MNTKLLRQKILDLAIRGKLTEQKKSDGTTAELLAQMSFPAPTGNLAASSNKKQDKSAEPKQIIPLDKSEAPFEIPENWEWVRLGDVCKLLNGDRGTNYPSKNDYIEEGIPFINAGCLNEGIVDYSKSHFISESKFDSLRAGKVQRGDVLYCLRGSLGKCGVIDHDNPAAISSSLCIFRFSSAVDHTFAIYFLQSTCVKDQQNVVDNGTAQPNLSAKDVAEYILPLPPLAEQQRIVTAIENAFAEITEIENNQELLKKHIKQGRQKILDLAIRGKLTEQLKTDGTTKDLLKQISSNVILSNAKNPGKSKTEPKQIIPLDKTTAPFEIPDNWEWVKLRDIGEYRKGPFGSALTKSMFVPKGLNTVKVYEQKNAIRKSETLGDYYIAREYFESSMRNFEVFPGDIIVSCAGTIGETFILPGGCEQGIINQALMRMKITPSVNLDYFLYYFDSVLKSQSGEEGKGTAIKNIPPFAIFKEYPFPLPPLAEQQRIVATIEQAFAEFDAMEQRI